MSHRFVLIRHAQATCNTIADDVLIVAHDRDARLTDTGRRQAAALAEHLPSSLLGRVVFSSPMCRARETAEALVVAKGTPIRFDPRLEEIRIDQPFSPPITQANWDALLETRVCNPQAMVLPGVETLAEQSQRVREFLEERHRERGDESVTLIISHAFTIELALLVLLGLELGALSSFRFRLSNTAVHVVENDAVGGASRLLMVNAKNHLQAWL